MPPIYFRCVRCQHPVEASAENAGRKMYCPVCYLELRVPMESTVAAVDPTKLYAADAGPVDVRDMQERKSLVSLPCPICHTNITVSRKQVGTKIVCPECATSVFVPREIERKIDLATKDPGNHILPVIDSGTEGTYEVRGFDVQNPQAHKNSFPVYCKLCGTMMYATEEQVGGELTCPDCETKTRVPPRPRKVPKPPPLPSNFEGAATFGISGEPIPEAMGTGSLVPVICKLCGTRMYARESEIGGVKTCPDCGVQTEIKAVPKEQMSQPELFGGEGYGVRTDSLPPPRPAIRTLVDYRTVDGSLDQELYRPRPESDLDSEELPQRKTERLALRAVGFSDDAFDAVPFERSPLPAHPFVTRIFKCFRSPDLIGRTLFSLCLVWVGYVIGTLLPGLLMLISGAFGVFCALLGLGLMANTCHSLFHWTAVGNDVPDRDDWIEYHFVDSNVFGIWLFLVVILAATPGHLVTTVLPTPETWGTLLLRNFFILLISAWLFFPVFFLSSMESGSYFSVLSLGTLRSIPYRTGVWIRFYLLTALLTAVLLTLGYFSAKFFQGEIVFFLLLLPIFAFFGLLYFRLLGRLAWTLEELARQDQYPDVDE